MHGNLYSLIITDKKRVSDGGVRRPSHDLMLCKQAGGGKARRGGEGLKEGRGRDRVVDRKEMIIEKKEERKKKEY